MQCLAYLGARGDDFSTLVAERSLLWLKRNFEISYDIKTLILGPRHESEIRVLNSILRWDDTGVT